MENKLYRSINKQLIYNFKYKSVENILYKNLTLNLINKYIYINHPITKPPWSIGLCCSEEIEQTLDKPNDLIAAQLTFPVHAVNK